MDLLEGVCAACGREGLGAEAKRCSRCKSATYCSVDCQKADWGGHKKICKVLNAGRARQLRHPDHLSAIGMPAQMIAGLSSMDDDCREIFRLFRATKPNAETRRTMMRQIADGMSMNHREFLLFQSIGNRSGRGGSGGKPPNPPIPRMVNVMDAQPKTVPATSKKKKKSRSGDAANGQRTAPLAFPQTQQKGRKRRPEYSPTKEAAPGSAMEAAAANMIPLQSGGRMSSSSSRDRFAFSFDEDDSDDMNEDGINAAGDVNLEQRVGSALGVSKKVGEFSVPQRRALFLKIAKELLVDGAPTSDVRDWELFKDIPDPAKSISDGLCRYLHSTFADVKGMARTNQSQYSIARAGTCLGRLYGILREPYGEDGAKSKKLRSKSSANNLIKDLLTMGKAGEIAADATDANNQATTAKFRKKLNTQPRGILPQESTPFNVEKKYRLPCPYCNHSAVMGLHDQADMESDHRKKMKEYEKIMKRFNKQAASTRGKAPTKPRKPHQSLACYCYKLHCNNMDNGNGCYVCEEAAAESDSSLFVKTDKYSNHRQCVCDICQCQCRQTFKESQRQTIVTTRLIEERSGGPKSDAELGNEFGRLFPIYFKSTLVGALPYQQV